MEYEDDEDISVSPLNEAAERRANGQFKAGTSGNPAGRPKGSGKAKSRMRTSLKDLYAMQPFALETIYKSVTGMDKQGNKVEKPSKEEVEMAKYVINTIEKYNSACLREESLIIGIRDKGNDNGASELESNQTAPATEVGAFSMDMPDEEDRGK